MKITSSDILNLSHALKDICEVNCNTPECLSQTLKLLLQYNLIEANLQFNQQLNQGTRPPSREQEQERSHLKQGTGIDLTNPNYIHPPVR